MSLPPLAERRFVLATDLDGTFLGGSKGDRQRLYDWIEANRDSVGLIFVTGRDPAFIADLCAGGVPWPEYAVGDVGTTIAEVGPETGVRPIPELESEIDDAWGNSGDRVRAAFADTPGLKVQPTGFRYRVSFDMDPDKFDRAAGVAKAEDMGFDTIISDGKYFDVLPPGVSKGPSIRRLLAHLGIDEGRVLVAGDTMNDATMLESGLPAVAVGGSDRELLDRVGGLESVYEASAIGAGGILEAITTLNLHDAPAPGE